MWRTCALKVTSVHVDRSTASIPGRNVGGEGATNLLSGEVEIGCFGLGCGNGPIG